jgi:hypothetical protein
MHRQWNQAAPARSTGSRETGSLRPTVVAASRSFRDAFGKTLAGLADAGNNRSVRLGHVARRPLAGLSRLHNAVAADGLSSCTLTSGDIAGLSGHTPIRGSLRVTLFAGVDHSIAAIDNALALVIAFSLRAGRSVACPIV